MTILACLLLSSCSPAPRPAKKATKPASSPPTTVNTASGKAGVFGPLPKHERKWTVYWQSATVTAVDSKLSSGNMRETHGTIYRDGLPSLTFSADSGAADQNERILTLKGHVQVTSLKQRETLFADRIEYDSATKLLKAQGNVHGKGSVGTIGTFSELMATSDFERVGTPALFGP